MGVPDDANPLNRRLPAEVVSRRRKPEKIQAAQKEEPLSTDKATVLALKAEHRLKWLSKALQKCQEGKVANTIIYDIVTNKGFTSDVGDKIGVKMFRAIRANLPLFSQKQQRFLQDGECRLVHLFGAKRGGAPGAAAAGADEAPEAKVRPEGAANAEAESMMARIRDFARQKEQERTAGASSSSSRQEAAPDVAGSAVGLAGRDGAPGEGIAGLWERITRLDPLARAEAVASLDAVTKELLEEFLEARIARATVSEGRGEGGAGSSASARAGKDAGRSASPSDARNGRASSEARRKAKETKPRKAKDRDGGSQGGKKRISRSRSRSRRRIARDASSGRSRSRRRRSASRRSEDSSGSASRSASSGRRRSRSRKARGRRS